jgi:hypothetical protein
MTSAINGVSSTWPPTSTQANPFVTAQADVMTAVAKELGVTTSALQSDLQSGQSLTQVAQAAGVSSSQLNTTVTTALQNANLPPGTNISAMASKIQGHHGGHHHHGGGGSSASSLLTALEAQTTSTTSSTALSSTSSSGTSTDTYA